MHVRRPACTNIPYEYITSLVSDVNLSDKMDYKAAERRLSFTVRAKMMATPDSRAKYLGIVIFLSMGDCVREAFFNPQISVIDRWRLLSRVLVFVRYWRAWVKAMNLNMKSSFITSQLMIDTVIMISAFCHMVILYRDTYKPGTKFIPGLFGSDQQERLNSELRSMSPDGEFTFYDVLMNMRAYHTIMACWADGDAAKILPPNLTRRGHNRSLYIPDVETAHADFPSDELLRQTYEAQVAWVQKHVLIPTGMHVGLRQCGNYDMPPTEDLQSLVNEAMEEDEDEEEGYYDESQNAYGQEAEIDLSASTQEDSIFDWTSDLQDILDVHDQLFAEMTPDEFANFMTAA